MKSILQGAHGVSFYIDDILVTGKTLEDHLKNLEEVLT
jgi:predicted amidophosphoribosyltransferase